MTSLMSNQATRSEIGEIDRTRVVGENEDIDEKLYNYGEETDTIEQEQPLDCTNGRIKYDDEGRMYHRAAEDDNWELAVYHSLIREELINEAAKKGRYNIPRASGDGATDITSFLESQKDWGIERSNRPNVLFIYEEPDERVNSHNVTPIWYHKGRRVIDLENQAIKKFPDIPDTLSSNAEGYLMEGIVRLDGAIILKDLRARMPPTISKNGNETPVWSVNVLSGRMRRFREKGCCIAWGKRAGRDIRKKFIDDLLPKECKEANSTEGFRDLFDHEIKLMELKNVGQFPERSRKDCKSAEEQRKKNQAMAQKKYEISKVKFDLKQCDSRNSEDVEVTGIGGRSEEASGQDDSGNDQKVCEIGETQKRLRAVESNRQRKKARLNDASCSKAAESEHASGQAYEKKKPIKRKSVDARVEGVHRDPGVVRSFQETMRGGNESSGSDHDGNHDKERDIDGEEERQGLEDATETNPLTWEEVHDLQAAMQPSRDHFVQVTGQLPPAQPAVEFWKNYRFQWGRLQSQLNEFWPTSGRDGTAPYLIALHPWIGGIRNWRSAERLNVPEIPDYIDPRLLNVASTDRGPETLSQVQAAYGQRLYDDAAEELSMARAPATSENSQESYLTTDEVVNQEEVEVIRAIRGQDVWMGAEDPRVDISATAFADAAAARERQPSR